MSANVLVDDFILINHIIPLIVQSKLLKNSVSLTILFTFVKFDLKHDS